MTGDIDRGSRRRTLDANLKPESGLAEWTSKIKALQRQVDQDEEEETRRLEEEIAASRLARLRRSTGTASRGSSVDLSKSDIAASLKDTDFSQSILEAKSASDRLQNQEHALRRLTGDSPKERVTHNDPSPIRKNAPKEPISLAAFIGGRAIGPRLTKHAPQQDAHDPTQFEQRGHITTPHPVFGSGGVAMPGMTKSSTLSTRSKEPGCAVTTNTNFTPHRDRKTSTPSVVKAFVERVEDNHALDSQSTGTIRTPTGIYPQRSSRVNTVENSSPTISAVQSSSLKPFSSNAVAHSATPGDHRTPSLARGPAFIERTVSKSPLPRTSPGSPHTSPKDSMPKPSPKPYVSYASSPRPSEPSPRRSIGGAQSAAPQTPSPTFLKPPPIKDPTPSISRLQGRGFVQSMVRVSSQLETASGPSSPTPSARSPEKLNEPGRKASVLGRWQFNNGSAPGSPSPPIISPKPVFLRKSFTSDVSSLEASPRTAKSVGPENTGRTLKSAVSNPSMSQAYMSRRAAKSEVGSNGSACAQGLGSGNTMISYIKPVKTGDNPSTTSPPSRPASRLQSRPPSAAARSRRGTPEPEVDELGVRVRPRTKSIDAGKNEGIVRRAVESHVTGKALSHPTKDRARKPRKARDSTKDTTLVQAPQAAASRGGDAASTEHAVSTTLKQHLPSKESVGILTKVTSDVLQTSGSKGSGSEDLLSSEPTTSVASFSAPDARINNDLGQDQPVLRVTPVTSQNARPVSRQPGEKSPSSPGRHGRIPSTGNRATVMEVALAFNEHEAKTPKLPAGGNIAEELALPVKTAPEIESSSTRADSAPEGETYDRPDVKSVVANRGPRNDSEPMPMDKRKSSYEKYSAFILPPLAEERTPIHSPAGTFSRRAVLPTNEDKKDELAPSSGATIANGAVVNTPVNDVSEIAVQSVDKNSGENDVVIIDHNDEPLPRFSVDHLLQTSDDTFRPDPESNTISVEVMNIIGTTASVINQDPDIFYDSEVLVVVHRSKVQSSGLVNTKVWSWIGNKATVGEREERKIQELARRYNTSRIAVVQSVEPPELVHVLGGRLAIRQGNRAHWSRENTAMHIIRMLHEVIYIDEIELTVKNLCSAFAYCISLLGTVYVWFGRGSTLIERRTALDYGRQLVTSTENLVELTEGVNDEDEMFWMILGDRDYARADYWQWRNTSLWNPRMWKISEQEPFVHELDAGSLLPSFQNGVYVVDAIWEYFVLIGKDARGKRLHIRIALGVADEMSKRTSLSKPFRPPVHALLFPTQLPADLRLALRGIDEVSLNQGSVPDHMNLICATMATEHLQRSAWNRTLLQDSQFLPLGLDPICTGRANSE